MNFSFFKKLFRKKIAKVETQSALTVHISGRPPFTMARDHRLFDQLKAAVDSKDDDAILKVIAIAEQVSAATQGKVTVQNGQVYFKNEIVHNIIADRILQFMAEGHPVQYLINFLERVMDNPSGTSRGELYLFLENGNLPITPDGLFKAYKWVTNDYLDCHTKTISNKVGETVEMERGKVDPNRDNLCSHGLHVCTQYYSKFGSKLLVVLIDPADVISVPSDYKNAKMRVCKYKIVEEVDPTTYGDIVEEAIVQYPNPTEELYDQSEPTDLEELDDDYDEFDEFDEFDDGYDYDDEDEVSLQEAEYAELAEGDHSADELQVGEVTSPRDLAGTDRVEGSDGPMAAFTQHVLTNGFGDLVNVTFDDGSENGSSVADDSGVLPDDTYPYLNSKQLKSDFSKAEWEKFRHDVRNKRSAHRLMSRFDIHPDELDTLRLKARKEIKHG